MFATVADNVTRASVVIDAEHHDLYVFAAGPCCAGGTIYYKKTTLANPQFGRGQGTPFISSAAHPEANNVTSTKQTVSSATGLLALAGDDQTRTYLYNRIDLGTDTTITSQPDAAMTTADASFGFTASMPGGTFLCSLDGAAETACTSPQSYTGLANGNHTFSVRSVEAGGTQDPSPATYSWSVAVPPPPPGDTVPPGTAITVRPTAVSTTRAATFTLACRRGGLDVPLLARRQARRGLRVAGRLPRSRGRRSHVLGDRRGRSRQRRRHARRVLLEDHAVVLRRLLVEELQPRRLAGAALPHGQHRRRQERGVPR